MNKTRSRRLLDELLGPEPVLKAEWILVAIILVLALISRFALLDVRVMSHDESEHTYFSWLLSEGSGYQHTPITHGPLQFHLLAFTYTLFGDSDATARYPVAISGVLAIGMLFFFRRWLGRAGALLAMALMLVSPYMLFYSRYVRNEGLILPVALLMFYALFRYFETREKRWLFILTAALTLHYLLKETAFIYTVELMIFMGAIFVWRVMQRPWKSLGDKSAFLTGLLAFILGASILLLHLRAEGVVEGEAGTGLSAMVVWGVVLSILGAGALLYTTVRSFGNQLRTDFPSLDVIIVCLTVTLPQLAAFPANILGWDPLDYQNVQTMTKTGILVFVVIAATAIMGTLWDWRRWQFIAAIFFFPYIIFYSTFFTNLPGIATGFVGSFGYWLAQQEVQRGGQPWYYYFALQIPVYEYVAALGSFMAGIIGLNALRKRLRIASDDENEEEQDQARELQFSPLLFLGYWSLISLLLFSYAGERMPWLTVHVALPLILLAGWAFASPLEKRLTEGLQPEEGTISKPFPVLAGISLLVLFGLLFLSARTAFLASFQNYDFGSEFMVYAHGERGVKDLMGQVEEVSRHVKSDLSLEVAYDVADGSGDSGVSWPLTWYLRNYPNARSFGPEITRDLRTAPLIISSDNNWFRLEPLLEGNFQQFEHIRMVWPMQDYWNLTWERIWNALSSAEYRIALWEIWFNRDYTLYGELTGKDFSHENWQPSDRMRLYVRNDLAYEVWGIGSPLVNLDEDYGEDPYEEGILEISANLILGSPGPEAGQFQNPRDIALAPDGTIYVADTRNHRIQHLSATGDVLHTWGTFGDILQGDAPSGTFNEPWGIAVGPEGSVYVADTWNHRIQKFGPDGAFIQMWGSFGQNLTTTEFWGPREVYVDDSGRIFVADTGNKRIAVLDEDGKLITQIGRGGFGPGDLDEPVGFDFNREGMLFIADTWNRRVQAFQETSPNTFTFSHEWSLVGWYGQSLDNKPFLSVAPGGEVCTTDPEGYRILCFSEEGEFLLGWGSFGVGAHQFDLPSSLVFEADGSAWVADSRNGRLMHFEIPWNQLSYAP